MFLLVGMKKKELNMYSSNTFVCSLNTYISYTNASLITTMEKDDGWISDWVMASFSNIFFYFSIFRIDLTLSNTM
jgi:hypothetical protein